MSSGYVGMCTTAIFACDMTHLGVQRRMRSIYTILRSKTSYIFLRYRAKRQKALGKSTKVSLLNTTTTTAQEKRDDIDADKRVPSTEPRESKEEGKDGREEGKSGDEGKETADEESKDADGASESRIKTDEDSDGMPADLPIEKAEKFRFGR